MTRALFAIALTAIVSTLPTAPAAAKGGLSAWVMQNARSVSRTIHATGGYRFDGFNDCYGFVRRSWNPILQFLKKNRFKTAFQFPRDLPIDDYPSSKWRPITDWKVLIPGEVLGTVQGHRYGGDVDYGLYGGMAHGVVYQFSNGGGSGPEFKPYTGRYHYYYIPTHELLKRIRK